jgi:hypothetical protein
VVDIGFINKSPLRAPACGSSRRFPPLRDEVQALPCDLH